MPLNTIAILAGAGELPALGARAAREQGRNIVAIRVVDAAADELSRHAAQYRHIPITRYGDVLAALAEAGVRDVYLMGKLPKTVVHVEELDAAARRVLSTVTERGDHAIIAALVRDMAAQGFTVRSQMELLEPYLVPVGFAAGRALSPREQADVRYGFEVACLLADRTDAGQTVVVKEGVVLALEAAEGTDETIRRGGRLGGPGAVVVKAKGRRPIDFELPAVGHHTIDAMADVGASVLAMEARRMLLVDAEGAAARAEELGIALATVERSETE